MELEEAENFSSNKQRKWDAGANAKHERYNLALLRVLRSECDKISCGIVDGPASYSIMNGNYSKVIKSQAHQKSTLMIASYIASAWAAFLRFSPNNSSSLGDLVDPPEGMGETSIELALVPQLILFPPERLLCRVFLHTKEAPSGINHWHWALFQSTLSEVKETEIPQALMTLVHTRYREEPSYQLCSPRTCQGVNARKWTQYGC